MALIQRGAPAAAPVPSEVLWPRHSPPTQLLLFAGAAVLSLTSLTCLAISIWVHIVALGGNDPRLLWNSIWLVQPLLVVVLAPIGVIVLMRGVNRDPFGLPRFVWRLQLALLVYYGAHFYLFLYRAQSVLRSDYTWQMFSAGWVVLFSLATAIYLGYLRRRLAP